MEFKNPSPMPDLRTFYSFGFKSFKKLKFEIFPKDKIFNQPMMNLSPIKLRDEKR